MDTLTLNPELNRDAGELVDVLHEHLSGVISVSHVNGRQEVQLANGVRILVKPGAHPPPRPAPTRPRAVLLETESAIGSTEIEHAIVEAIPGSRVIGASMRETLISLPDRVHLVLVVRE